MNGPACRWCGGPTNADGTLCVSGWTNCAGKIPHRLELARIRDDERRAERYEELAESSPEERRERRRSRNETPRNG